MSDSELKVAMVVAAAGYGTRLNSGLPKQYVPLLGIPMIQRTLSALNSCQRVDAMLLVVNFEDVEYCRSEIALEQLDDKVLKVVAGGEKRPESVRNGLIALAEMGTWDLVGVHDGARPLVTSAEIERVVEALEADETLDGAVPGIPSVDTVKIADESGVVVSTPKRHLLWRAQTPQVFRWRALMDAYTGVGLEELDYFTDDASLVEGGGGRIRMVEGSAENFKITDRLDLQHAEQILAGRRM
jgi:2-C-methyl-D-erythritol 4-phosphate cytidylyltransferase